MAKQLVIAVIGADRPGLVERLAEVVAQNGGNWLDSRMSVLAGQFAGTVLVSVPDAQAEALTAGLQRLGSDGLQVLVEPAGGRKRGAPPAHAMYLELMGQDRPGIVQDISRVLHARGINIDDLVTERVSGAMGGGTLFKAQAELRVPNSVSDDTIRHDLEALANELMVDIEVRELSEEEV